jgi:hypothetical protein
LPPEDYDGCPFLGKGLSNIVEYGKAQLTQVEREFYWMYCFLEKKWISKPSDYDLIDPEIKVGLITMMELESKKAEKEENKMKAKEALAGLKARSGL